MRIYWMTVNGPRSGEVVREEEFGIMVLLDNGKYVLVDKESVRDELAV